MPWKINRSKRVTLEKFGFPDFWIEVDSPLSELYGNVRKMEAAIDSGDDDEDVNLSSFAKYILDWNLTDPETDEPLKVPDEKNFASIERLPVAVILFIRDVISEETQSAVKKGTESEYGTTTLQPREPNSLDQAATLFSNRESQAG